jgi:tetratricopeptide (TPR) repeat protein
MSAHLSITGPTRRQRRAVLEREAPDTPVLSCHRHEEGPYTGTAALLRRIVPDAQARWPEVVTRHREELLVAVPELERLIGPPRPTLISRTPAEERTRYFDAALIRAMSQGIVSFLITHARRLGAEGPLIVAFDDVHEADPTQQELVGLLVRRADPERLRVLVAGATPPPVEPGSAAVRMTTLWDSSPNDTFGLDTAALAARFVAADGASDEPDERTAYDALDAAARAALHDRRADRLEADATWGLRLGALPYHRERGSDPAGAGRQALRVALERAVAVGFSAATLDFGARGRALCDPDEHESDYCHFSAKAAVALVSLDRAAEAEAIYIELRRRYTAPKVHMTTSYGLSMLHTRFLAERDHDLALAHQNNAIALAGLGETDPAQRVYEQVFHRNALALIEMHRGRLDRAMDLIEAGMAQLDRELPADRYLVHRSQLVHNRARLLVALGRLDEAHAAYTRLIEWDPAYVEYHADRAAIARRRGDLAAAAADYGNAMAVAPPMYELHYNRADVHTDAGDLAGAEADLRICLELEPDVVDARCNLAQLLVDDGRAAEAEALVTAGLRRGGEDPSLLAARAAARRVAGDDAGALDDADRALRLDADCVPARLLRAGLHHDAGRLAEAAEDLAAAIALTGPDPDLLAEQAELRARLEGAAA